MHRSKLLVAAAAVVAGLAASLVSPAGAQADYTDFAAMRTGLGPDTPVASSGTPGRAPALAGQQGISGTPGTGLSGAGQIDDHPVVGRPPAGGSAGVESIIGDEDNRTRVNPTTTFPVNAIVQLVRDDGTDIWGCSGWLYGANILATAGHCVHPGSGLDGGGTNGFYPPESFEIIPGRNFPTRPYGTCQATELMSVLGWMDNGNREYDYGAIRLDCNAGNTTGTWGAWWQTASLTGTATTVSGYPCDQTFGEQWRHGGRTVTTTQVRRIFYDNDTAGCQSGSPVYQNRAAGSAGCAGWCVMAIHTTGGTTANGATRITESVLTNLVTWRG